ncbi:MAG TPA: serine/threonine-protein kinase, partial [Ignavibacteriaceae bacterium]|nr:serine/threonine-protein kinase [Ignavibacteriaceae bacterium]
MEKLGEGGMGVVYKAEDTKLKRLVALKFLPPELTRNSDAKERFITEAQAASALDHPGILTIYEINETNEGQVFISMACYGGEILKKKIEQSTLEIDEVINIAIQIADGLSRAHEAGIIHRDVKPANIMVTDRNEVKILDFGLAKILSKQSEVTRMGTITGTVKYMSPEQIRGENIDHRTDIWSLGILLYEMVTSQAPFKGEYEQAIIYSIMNEQHKPVSALRENIPADLEKIIDKALNKDLAERYQSMVELLVDLKRLKDKRLKGDFEGKDTPVTEEKDYRRLSAIM